MKVVSYRHKNIGFIRTGLLEDGYIIDVSRAFDISDEMNATLSLVNQDHYRTQWRTVLERTDILDAKTDTRLPLDEVELFAPGVAPRSLRGFYAFEEHVKNILARRGLEMAQEWYEVPVFFYANPHSIYGPDQVVPYPNNTQMLDFEIQIAAVIGNFGRDIPLEKAESFIAGFTIMNNWTARDIQRREQAVGIGPAKSKDFATSLGPWIVTLDELEDRRAGKGYDLAMSVRRNGVEISRGNWKTIHFSFAEMIAHASENVMLYPGDVLGSGPVSGGCILDLGSDNVGGWLCPGDVIELEIERLGVLRNVIGELA